MNSEVDFFAGGGIDFFARRLDGKDYLQGLKDNGFEIDTPFATA